MLTCTPLKRILLALAATLGLTAAPPVVKVEILSRLHVGDFDIAKKEAALWYAELDAVGAPNPSGARTNAPSSYPSLGNRVWAKIRVTITGDLPCDGTNALRFYANTTHDAPIIEHTVLGSTYNLNFSSATNPQVYRNVPRSNPASNPFTAEFWVGGQIGSSAAQGLQVQPGLYAGTFPIELDLCGTRVADLPRVPVSIRFGPGGSLTLKETRSLHFGVILPGKTEGDVVLDHADGSRTATQGIRLVSNTHRRGEFTITNLNSWQSSANAALTLPKGPVVLTKVYAGTPPTQKATMEARDFKTRIGSVETRPGEATAVVLPFSVADNYTTSFLVGATLKVQANQEGGEYLGDYPVTLTQL